MEFIRPRNEGIIVVDYGSQYTLLITRRLREIGVYSEMVGSNEDTPPKDFKVHGVILSGGPDTVTDESARSIPKWLLEMQVPVLGICYGMQLLVEFFGGKLRSGEGREYGRAPLKLESDLTGVAEKVFKGIPSDHVVWMSHGDDMDGLPKDFKLAAKTEDGVAACIYHEKVPMLGLQYHPEVHHSDYGTDLLENFAIDVCEAPKNWLIESMVEATIESIKETVGDGNVLVACSGGVDSSVAAALLTKALGSEKVTGIFVDNGLLRKNEVPWVSQKLRHMGVNLHVEDSKDLFYSKLNGLSDPEDKRKAIGYTFIDVFEKYAREHEGEFTHLGQGTLYPDVIESAGHGDGSKVIKSHHNVGGLPEKLALDLVEPFRYLFKDEVRKIGRELGLSDEMINRHPFPGPGLGIRIPGEISAEKVKILQEADDIFIRELKDAGLYDKVWQAFVVLLPVKSVGVMGDNRTYQWACTLRAVEAMDGMTAAVANLPYDFITKVSDQIVRKVDGINRVLYDITSKPPGTIEWE
jgi:GMP synthase (glutamine-hydrolysing)